jgi:hypothetical protein
MAVQHVPPPRISPAGQIEGKSDQQDNQLLNSTVTRQTTVRWLDHAGVTKHLLHHHITTWRQNASGSHNFGKTTLVSGSHKWRLDFTSRTPTQTKTDSTRYLQPSRNQVSLPKYPTAYGIHQHKISISLSRLNSSDAILIPKSVNFTDFSTRSFPNFCERCVTWHHQAFLKTYYIPFGWNECPSVYNSSFPLAKESSWSKWPKLLTGSLITGRNIKSWPRTHVVSHLLPLNSPPLTTPQRKDLPTWRNNSASLLLSRVYKPRWTHQLTLVKAGRDL